MTTKRSVAANAEPEAAPKKLRGRPFPKGLSGNPAGKRPGTRHRATVLAEQLLSADLKAVVAKVVRKAKAGDMGAARLILDRVLPPRRGRPVRFPLPLLKTTGDVVAALEAVMAAMANGELSPAEAMEVSSVIELQRRAIETVEIEARLAQLEQRIGSNEDQD
ncbi:DUF5681 domain-containing protein [Bradyrhizobium japonicum]|uniref:DUF5681 domain-containing protein n=1 Tax=Bradyrhizobium japonicum TaxID=375 RepID=UPI00200CBFFA|nr:DUF5681 domain-containing protein [Bradyrhizobium japonicum]UQD95229.1 hypothetical protein JEY30_26780 [Bradyrhizobium japonicum]